VLGRLWPTYNPQALSGRLETSVNGSLLHGGITDAAIKETVHSERQRWGIVWVETHRRIEVPDLARASALLEPLRQSAARYDCRLNSKVLDGHLHATISLGPFVFQTFEFFPAAKVTGTKPLPRTPEVALVIDDVAYDLNAMDHFAALGIPLTFAILPRDKRTKQLAEKATGMKFPVILHLPMEPLDLEHNNPGGAALYLKMTPAQLHEQFEKDVLSVPNIVGINNHMGSAFTEDESKMEIVLKWVKQKNLFFLDSHTSAHSIVSKAAHREGVPCLVNETFLDNSDEVAAIEHQLDLVLKLALRQKRTIAIGHYRRKFLVEALDRKIPEFRARGVSFVTLPSFYY